MKKPGDPPPTIKTTEALLCDWGLQTKGADYRMSLHNRILVPPRSCHTVSSPIPHRMPAPRVRTIMRSKLCKYSGGAASNLSMSWQYSACLRWKVKKPYFCTKVPLKLNFLPWAEESKGLLKDCTFSSLTRSRKLSFPPSWKGSMKRNPTCIRGRSTVTQISCTSFSEQVIATGFVFLWCKSKFYLRLKLNFGRFVDKY